MTTMELYHRKLRNPVKTNARSLEDTQKQRHLGEESGGVQHSAYPGNPHPAGPGVEKATTNEENNVENGRGGAPYSTHPNNPVTKGIQKLELDDINGKEKTKNGNLDVSSSFFSNHQVTIGVADSVSEDGNKHIKLQNGRDGVPHSTNPCKADLGVESPEGGWGWMVILGTALAHIIFGVVVRTFGVIYLRMLLKYNGTPSATGMVGVINIAACGICGPLTTRLLVRFSHRTVTIVGGIIMAVAMVITAFAPNIIMVYISYGLIGGCGLSMTYTPGYLIIGQYFQKRHGLTMGLANLGSAIGPLCFAPIMAWLFEEYGYTGTLIVVAGVCLQCCVGGALYRPLTQNYRSTEKSSTQSSGQSPVPCSLNGNDKETPQKLHLAREGGVIIVTDRLPCSGSSTAVDCEVNLEESNPGRKTNTVLLFKSGSSVMIDTNLSVSYYPYLSVAKPN